MRTGYRIGRLFGIDIRVDSSWVFIFLLITWNLSVVLGDTHQDWNTGLRWGMAIAAALLFFASVLAHELAHSLVARAQGVPVRSITLFLFGGVSSIERDPASPRAEFAMAIVGPLTSIVLGVILVGIVGAGSTVLQQAISAPAQAIARMDPLFTILLWLGSTNLILGVFNMVPGFPLDGGRVLRSILWAATGSFRRGTRWASWVGQAIAFLMIAAGIAMVFGAQIPFFGTGLLSGLWLAFIGWFLQSAAQQSYQQVAIHDLLGGVQVQRMMRRDPPTCEPGCTISSLVHDHIMGTDDHAFPVLEEGRMVGLVTLEDVRKVQRDHWDVTTVSDIMTPTEKLITASPEEDAAGALDKLTQRDVNQLPVLRDGMLVGLLRRRDIIRYLQLQARQR
jgi:Zn-dependent protease/predicted transcriptional regulator